MALVYSQQFAVRGANYTGAPTLSRMSQSSDVAKDRQIRMYHSRGSVRAVKCESHHSDPGGGGLPNVRTRAASHYGAKGTAKRARVP